MALEVFVYRSPSGSLVPAWPSEAEKLASLPKGETFRADIIRPRNLKFHRKAFALFKLAFDLWSETLPALEFHGREVRPEFERFRKDLVIMAGFFRPVFNAKQEMRLEAESLSFAGMTEERFEAVYSEVLDVVLQKILPHMEKSEIEAAVDRVMAFA